MAAPLKFLRNCRFKSLHNLQFVRTNIGPPKSIFPSVDAYRRPHKLDHDEYFGDAPLATQSWAEIQAEMNPVDEELSEPSYIGEVWKGQARKPWHEAQQEVVQINKQNFELEKATRLGKHDVSLEEVDEIYRVESLPNDAMVMAKHYGIFQDLFKGAFFLPVTQLDVCFECDEEHVFPVLRGNEISPAHAGQAPYVSFDAEPDMLYTLLLTNPDGHLTDNDGEYLHWMIANIKEGDIGTGDLLCDYLRPFPPRGTGWHRHVFLLFKQSKQLDLSEHQRPANCTCLKQRTFSTYDFYRQHEDDFTPVGVSFFQAEWDSSVKHTYHHVLNMRVPSFEYAHPQEYRAPQKRYPHRQPFDRYMDKYRDKKDLAEEALRLRLSQTNPFEPHVKDPYERVFFKDIRHKPSWLQRKEQLAYRRVEHFKDVDA